MEKELQDLLDNYERSIYGKEVPKIPTIHQIHLLLDYIANQGVQLKKQQEINQKAIEFIKKFVKDIEQVDCGELWVKNRLKYVLQILEDKEV